MTLQVEERLVLEAAERPEQILVVDDDLDHATMLSRCLEVGGYTCLLAGDGPAALETACRERPDLVVLDVNMPGMSGYEVCGRLKADPATADTPIIFLTGRAATFEKVEGLARGATDYVTKPFDPSELLARVQTALRMKSAFEALKMEQSKLAVAATTDGLTGLANRAYFSRRLSEEFAAAVRTGARLACLMLDIDHFKEVNDRHGHLAGDAVLRAAGELLRDNVRGDDVAARFGGEEFVVLMVGSSLDGAGILAERIRVLVERHEVRFADAMAPIRTTLSVGVAIRQPSQRSPHELVEEADRALYRAKAAGRNRVALAS